MKSHLQFLSIRDNSLFDTYREIESGGRTWLVVNGIPLVEGVLNGRFVPADEFGAFVNDWNDLPVVLRHPKQNGGSARVVNPDVPVVGRFYNSRLDAKRLAGEYWLDKQSLKDAGTDGEIILNLISRNLPIETSTGYWSESMPEAGKFNGKDYNSTDRNIHPDHIALLSDEIGACSIKDGCGMNRNQAMCQNCNNGQTVKTNAALGSYEGKIQTVYEAFNKQFRPSTGDEYKGELWVSETYPDHIISRVDDEWYWIGYTVENGEYTFDDRAAWKKAVRIEEYLVVQQNATGKLPAEGKKIYERVYQEYKDKDMSDEDAAKRAWGAVKSAGWYQEKDGVWKKKETKKNQQEPDLEALAVTLLLAESIHK